MMDTKTKISKDCPSFVPYDDENIEHVMAGVDYGQTASYPHTSSTWDETDSSEYPDYVSHICDKISRNRIKILA